MPVPPPGVEEEAVAVAVAEVEVEPVQAAALPRPEEEVVVVEPEEVLAEPPWPPWLSAAWTSALPSRPCAQPSQVREMAAGLPAPGEPPTRAAAAAEQPPPALAAAPEARAGRRTGRPRRTG